MCASAPPCRREGRFLLWSKPTIPKLDRTLTGPRACTACNRRRTRSGARRRRAAFSSAMAFLKSKNMIHKADWGRERHDVDRPFTSLTSKFGPNAARQYAEAYSRQQHQQHPVSSPSSQSLPASARGHAGSSLPLQSRITLTIPPSTPTLCGCNLALGSAARRVPIGAAIGRIGLTPKAGSDVVTSGGASKALVPHETVSSRTARRGGRVQVRWRIE